jgi:predicted kinase
MMFNSKFFLLSVCAGTVTFFATARQGSWLFFPSFISLPGAYYVSNYDWSKSTEENYRSKDGKFYGKYAHLRQTLDYNYHNHYTKQRQQLQDSIIDSFLSCVKCSENKHWIVFTAGSMGAGKSWTLRHLYQRGDFPLNNFVTVDADEVRHHMPEFETYVRLAPEEAGYLTRKEAGLVTELLTLAALQQGYNVLVDGSLRDAAWYQAYFERLRQDYPDINIGILHVTAPPELVYQRAAKRAQQTGRVVPMSTLNTSMEQVPTSVALLRDSTDFCAEIFNGDGELKLDTPNMTWKDFREAWACNVVDKSNCTDDTNGSNPQEGLLIPAPASCEIEAPPPFPIALTASN